MAEMTLRPVNTTRYTHSGQPPAPDDQNEIHHYSNTTRPSVSMGNRLTGHSPLRDMTCPACGEWVGLGADL
jgi:hypothetical protein